MEKDWPPVSECFQFKLGLMDGVLCKYPWEDDKYSFDFNSYYPPIPEELASLRKLLDYLHKNEFQRKVPEDIRNCPFCRLPADPLGVDILKDPVWDMDPIPGAFHLSEHVWPDDSSRPRLVTPFELDTTKKYLNQVRNSRGYDVDCIPKSALVIPKFFDFVDFPRVMDGMKMILDSAIVHINKKTDKVYQLEKILKLVNTATLLYLITFTAKVKKNDDCDTFIATIDQHRNVLECLLKPVCDAPGPDHYPDFVLQPIQVPRFLMKRRAALPGEQDPMLSEPKGLLKASKGPIKMPDDKEAIVCWLNKYDVDRVEKMVKAGNRVIQKIGEVSDKRNAIASELKDVTSSYNELADEIAKSKVINIFQLDEIEAFKAFLKVKPDWTGEVHVKRKKPRELNASFMKQLKEVVKGRYIKLK